MTRELCWQNRYSRRINNSSKNRNQNWLRWKKPLASISSPYWIPIMYRLLYKIIALILKFPKLSLLEMLNNSPAFRISIWPKASLSFRGLIQMTIKTSTRFRVRWIVKRRTSIAKRYKQSFVLKHGFGKKNKATDCSISMMDIGY